MFNPIEEQETTISFSRTDQGASIWTSDSTMITKLDKLCARSENYTSKEERTKSGELIAKEYTIKDKSLIRFIPGKRILSDAQKEKMAARMRNIKNTANN